MAKHYQVDFLDEKGRGLVGDLHVPFTYPGDVAEARMVNKRKKAGKLSHLVSPSPLRQTPPCKYFGICGGCPWQGLKYAEQLKFKEQKVRSLFGDCAPIIPSPEQYFYRNRMDYAFGPDYTLGLKDDRDNVINIENCWLMSEASNAIMDRLRYFVSWKKLANFRDGIMRHAVIREGKNIPNTVLNILTSDQAPFPLEELWAKVQEMVQGVTWSINLSPADRSYGEIQKSLGQDHLMESLAGLKFRIPVQSFFQTNPKQAEKLLEIVGSFAALQGGETLLDLYAGTGSIGLSLAGKAKSVLAVEESQEAVELSKANAELNGIRNFSPLAGRAEELIKSLEGKFETIILDPPRPGVHKKVLQKIGEIKPRQIVYVSCNPTTQAFDLNILREFGYQIANCQPLDMFPHTPHIENIISLKS